MNNHEDHSFHFLLLHLKLHLKQVTVELIWRELEDTGHETDLKRPENRLSHFYLQMCFIPSLGAPAVWECVCIKYGAENSLPRFC